jgi:hypothetical protein
MKTRIAAIAAALILGVAPISSAMAFDIAPRHAPLSRYDVETTGSLDRTAPQAYRGCPMSSAAEGNANQQTRPVMQYGQTSGGNRC